jgi:hypothetical protein
MHPRIAIVFIGAVLLVGACTSATTPGGTAPAGAGGGGGATITDPCSLLTQSEVSAVVGHPVGPGTSDVEPKTCDWQFPADGVPSIQATINIEGGTLSDTCNKPSNPALGLTITQVSGVGDGACFLELAGLGAGTNLTFGKNGQLFSTGVVLGVNATREQILEADKALALDALARI